MKTKPTTATLPDGTQIPAQQQQPEGEHAPVPNQTPSLFKDATYYASLRESILFTLDNCGPDSPQHLVDCVKQTLLQERAFYQDAAARIDEAILLLGKDFSALSKQLPADTAPSHDAHQVHPHGLQRAQHRVSSAEGLAPVLQ